MLIFFLNLIILIQGLALFGFSLYLIGKEKEGEDDLHGLLLIFSFLCCLCTGFYLMYSIYKALQLYY